MPGAIAIEVRLFASLRGRLPDAPRGRATLEVAEGTTVADLLEELDIPNRVAQMLLVNGEQAPRTPEGRASVVLAEGDVVAIFPALAGG